MNRLPVGSARKSDQISVCGGVFAPASKVFAKGIETATEFVNAGEARAKLSAEKSAESAA